MFTAKRQAIMSTSLVYNLLVGVMCMLKLPSEVALAMIAAGNILAGVYFVGQSVTDGIATTAGAKIAAGSNTTG